MTRPFRATDFLSEDGISGGTSPGGAPMVESGRTVVESLEHSIVGRTAQAGVADWGPRRNGDPRTPQTGLSAERARLT